MSRCWSDTFVSLTSLVLVWGSWTILVIFDGDGDGDDGGGDGDGGDDDGGSTNACYFIAWFQDMFVKKVFFMFIYNLNVKVF